MADSPFAVPTQFQVYDSYAIDPQWQRYYTWAWLGVTSVFIAGSIPYIYRSAQGGRWSKGWAIRESTVGRYDPASDPRSRGGEKRADARDMPVAEFAHRQFQEGHHRPTPLRDAAAGRTLRYAKALFQTVFSVHISLTEFGRDSLRLRTDEASYQEDKHIERKKYLALTIGQLCLLAGYIVLVMVCIFKDAELRTNANRPGFIALSMLTPLFLLATKNNPLSFLLGSSYLSLNWAHRWVGRLIWLSATVHGCQWIVFYARADGGSETLKGDKVLRGVASWVLLTVLAGTSIRPVRRRWYQTFWYTHILAFVGFFAAVSYHTPYSRPWIWPPIALYVFDISLRICKYRFKDGFLVALSDNLTMIHIPDCDDGWLPTQHIKIRILSQGVMFESHPLTITNAGSPSSSGRGITLYAKVAGGWTGRINKLAKHSVETGDEKYQGEQTGFSTGADDFDCIPVQILIDGPYGGLKLDLAGYQNVLLVAGGSGVTFALGCIEESLRRVQEGGQEGRLELIHAVWVVRDLHIVHALAPVLVDLHERGCRSGRLQLEVSIYLTGSISSISGLSSSLSTFAFLATGRPSIRQLVLGTLKSPPLSSTASEGGEARIRPLGGGGQAVIACGPESLVQDIRNTVASMNLADKVEAGPVDFHGECYTI